ncbi:putative quinol monooxygenase [Marinifilum sp. RC60d5]|uniref:putative quinol monooxygenase n=1 Tax=Marinifilum sp. RC60d5 TaxID=3458414 RepID=UPI0040367123
MKKLLLIIACAMSLCANAEKYKIKNTMNVLVEFTIKADRFQEFKKAAIHSLNLSQQEDGNLEMKLYTDKNRPNILFVYSRWKNEAAYETHTTFSYSKDLGLLAKEVLESAPKIMKLGETKFKPSHYENSVNPEDKEETLFFIFKIKDGYRDQVIKRFEDHVANTHNEKGNLFFDFYTVEGADDTFVVYENWRNPAAIWDIHMKQSYAEKTGALLNEAIIGKLEDGMNFVSEVK